VVEGEDLLGDGVNFAARLNGSMSTPAGTESRHLRKASEFFSACWSSKACRLLDHPDCAQPRLRGSLKPHAKALGVTSSATEPSR
jgi:hypothetical protein